MKPIDPTAVSGHDAAWQDALAEWFGDQVAYDWSYLEAATAPEREPEPEPPKPDVMEITRRFFR